MTEPLAVDEVCRFMDGLVATFQPDDEFIAQCKFVASAMRWATEEPDQPGILKVIEHLENLGAHGMTP